MKRKHEVNPIIFPEIKNENKLHNYIQCLRIKLFSTYLQFKKRLQSGFKNFRRFSFNFMYMHW